MNPFLSTYGKVLKFIRFLDVEDTIKVWNRIKIVESGFGLGYLEFDLN